jgi:tetratricopeptide (TPR) repeat protein
MSTLYELARPAEVSTYHLAMRRQFRAEADDDSAAHLLKHYNELVGRSADTVRQQEPVVPPHQLPHDIPDFAGREDLLTALDKATKIRDGGSTSGVVILDGMAGVGKTVLAVRWGYRARAHFPDGELFVNLNGFADAARVEPSTVVDDFLTALGHEPDRTMGRRSRELLLRRVLDGRRMLVILDNAHDTAHVAGLVQLLSSCLVLITSRQRLGPLAASTGARWVRVEPMTSEEGADLLTRRLGGQQRLDPERHAHVVAQCGGLPLMITLLAGHVARAPAAELSGFVDGLDRRQMITDIGEHGDGVVNVRAFFTQSYLALGQAERRLFRLIALHPGPDISIEAACACDGRTRAETSKSLGALVSAHMLEQPAALDRCRFHDLIAEFATECAELDESPASRDAADQRMLAFYLRSARNAAEMLYPSEGSAPMLDTAPAVDAAGFGDDVAAKKWFDRERTNLTAAISYAAERGLNQYTWRVADPVATHLVRRGNFVDSRAVRHLAVEGARADGHVLAEASTLLGLGLVQLTLGEHVAAQPGLVAARRLFEEAGSEIGVAATLHQLGRAHMMRGDPAEALAEYLRSLQIVQRIPEPDPEALCWLHRSLGEVYRAIEKHDQALVHLHQSMLLAQRIGDASAHGSCLAMIGSTQCELGDLHTAAAYVEKALGIVEEVELAVAVQVWIALAEVTAAQGAPGASVEHAKRAVALCVQANSVADEARARDAQGRAHHANAELPEAVLSWQIAADLYQRSGNSTRASLVEAKIHNAPAGGIDLPQARPGVAATKNPIG